MTVPITLQNVTTFTNDTTAATTVNNNSAAIVTALGNALDTAGDKMLGTLDANSNRILNLPKPISGQEPLRLTDASVLNGGGTITTGLTSVGLALPVDYTVTGSPLTGNGTITATYANTPTGSGGFVRATSPTIATATLSSPTMTTPTLGVASATTVNKVTLTPPATGSTLTIADGKTLTASNTLTLAGTDSSIMTFQGTDTYTGRATTDILTNKTLSTTGAGNHIQISGVDITRGQILGTGTNDNGSSGNIGEYISSNIVSASAVSLGASGVSTNITSISLTAGDWDVWGSIFSKPAGTTTTSFMQAGINTVSATLVTDSSLSASFSQLFMPNTSGTGGATAGGGMVIPLPTCRLSLTSPTTVFLIAAITFGVSTMSAFGNIQARRVR